MTSSGPFEIMKCVEENEIFVKSVCADYFMLNTFHDKNIKVVENLKILWKL